MASKAGIYMVFGAYARTAMIRIIGDEDVIAATIVAATKCGATRVTHGNPNKPFLQVGPFRARMTKSEVWGDHIMVGPFVTVEQAGALRKRMIEKLDL